MAISMQTYIDRLEAATHATAEFLGWDGEFNGSVSRCIMKCRVDGTEWTASINNLTRGRGCPTCGKVRIGEAVSIRIKSGSHKPREKKDPAEYVVVVERAAAGRYEFVGWDGEFSGRASRVVARCLVDGHEWSSSLNNLLLGRGCPRCCKRGFDITQPATLYALRSTCGSMVKVGITNDPCRRLRELKKATPFEWDCIELATLKNGYLIAQAEREIHAMTTQATFLEPFKGYTEWRLWDERIPQWYKDTTSKSV